MTKKITKQDFITINAKGLFVDGKTTKQYHGKTIEKFDEVKTLFDSPATKDMLEIRIMQSDTMGETFKIGNPEPSETGSCVWIQVVSKHGISPWVFRLCAGNGINVAGLCAFQTAWTLRQYHRWRDFLLNATKGNMAIYDHFQPRYTR